MRLRFVVGMSFDFDLGEKPICSDSISIDSNAFAVTLSDSRIIGSRTGDSKVVKRSAPQRVQIVVAKLLL